jgi:integrase
VTVYDRWHKARPRPGEEKCRQHKMVPSAGHGQGDRWQVRWRDESGKQCKRNFPLRDGKDPDKHAAAFDTKVKAELDAGTYVDPSAGLVTFREYAEGWRKSRVHDLATATRIESAFRNHVYADPQAPGKTPRGGPAIGDYALRMLARRTSVIQAWISGIRLHPNAARKVIADVSQVFAAALDEGIVIRNPLSARSVQKPKSVKTEAVPWTAAEIEAVASELPGRLAVLPYLGSACGMRQGELLAVAVGDLDFLRKVLRVEAQIKYVGRSLYFAPVKNGKARDVPVADPVIPVLAEHVRQYPAVDVTLPWGSPDGRPVTRRLLFTMPDGKPVNRNGFNRLWRKAWRVAGVDPALGRLNGCHVLRHTAASTWLSAGLSLAKVAAYLGDTKEVVLATYAHFLPDDDDRARGIMSAFFAPAPEAADEGSCAPVVPGGSA